MLDTLGKLSTPGSQKSSFFSCCVKWCNAMDHNEIGTLHLVWAVTSEQMKIKAKLFLLDIWCHSFLWSDTIICHKGSCHQCCKAHIFCTFFKKIVFWKIVWVVAITVPGQFKTTQPYLWQIQLQHLLGTHEFLQRPCCDDIFEAEVYSFFMKKSQTLASNMSENSCLGFFLEHTEN